MGLRGCHLVAVALGVCDDDGTMATFSSKYGSAVLLQTTFRDNVTDRWIDNAQYRNLLFLLLSFFSTHNRANVKNGPLSSNSWLLLCGARLSCFRRDGPKEL